MDLTEKKRRLDEAKSAYLNAKDEIETLRLSIAEELCPLNVGDRVDVIDNGKEYQGVVEGIHYGLTDEEMLDPVVGAATGWSVHGKRIKKTTNTVGKWGFGFSSFDAEFRDGKWVVTHKTLEERLGIK